MEKCQLTVEQIASYGQFLYREERSSGTIEKYLRDINTFVQWLGDRDVTKELTATWKSCLLEQGYAPCHHQFHAFRPEWVVQISGLERVSGEAFEDTTPLVPGHKSGIDKE